eukprot:CAMPEP_0182463648 /NCGR_PEP_ID=MMETSP1319-20130603/7810_1 /TAXON_ID=172717 /ORGANISM="Bolidomonas pacifica, Strain RCC208" /LENGTH=115 /DNA_ID=CAMNT_0024663217 /DNA_START=32 /DNA_END=379 /DNA_ORIENTATION=+
MRHVAAYLLLVLGGNASPSAADVSAALSSVGVDADDERLNKMIADLEGKDLEELMEAGRGQLAKFGGGGGGGGGGAGGDAGGAAAAEEEKKEEEEEESAEEMGGMDMFGGGDDGY